LATIFSQAVYFHFTNIK